MSPQLIRSVVPPRDLAASITARAVLRAGWAVALVYLSISVITLVDLWISRSYKPSVVVSLVALAAVIVALSAMIRRPSPARGVLYLAVGTVAGFAFDYGLLIAEPGLNLSGTYLLNRITVAMVLIGAVGKSLIGGVVWCSMGCLLGTAATVAAQLSLGLPPKPGFGPFASLMVYIVIILMFVLIRRSQHRFNPDFSEVGAETARMAGRRELEERAVALVHDTVLNDLAAIANGRDELDERMRERIRRDIAAVSSAQLGPGPETRETAADDLRDELLALMREFQWRGLTVDISGGEALDAEIEPHASSILVSAVSGCLENVLLHSGTDSAEVFVDVTEESLTVMIVDHGIGFDPTSVPKNRIGIRGVLVKQIESCGGTVKIWSAVGAGTSVIITIPLGSGND